MAPPKAPGLLFSSFSQLTRTISSETPNGVSSTVDRQIDVHSSLFSTQAAYDEPALVLALAEDVG